LNYTGLVIIKSTVLPGTSRILSERYRNLIIVHSPEFLNASSGKGDVIEAPQAIYGFRDSKAIHIHIERVKQISEPFLSSGNTLVTCLYEESEMAKYGCNVFYALKNTFFNLLRLACEHTGSNFNLVRDLIVKNGWVHPMHTFSPGRDGKRGFGGMCLPKDLEAFISWGLSARLPFNLLESVQKINQELRKKPIEDPQLDWEEFFYG